MDNEKLDRIVLLLENMNKDISDLKQGQDKLEQKFDKLEQKVDNLEERFDNLEQRFDNLEQEQNEMKQKIDTIIDGVNATNTNLAGLDKMIFQIDKKLDVLEGQTNINTIDITRLRAAR